MIAVRTRRGWLTERAPASLSLSLSPAVSYLPFEYMVFGFLAPPCVPLSPRLPSAVFRGRADLSIARIIGPFLSFPYLPRPGMAWSAVFRTHTDQ
jgi:hypothetical protein